MFPKTLLLTDLRVFLYCKTFNINGFVPANVRVMLTENPTVILQCFHFQYARHCADQLEAV